MHFLRYYASNFVAKWKADIYIYLTSLETHFLNKLKSRFRIYTEVTKRSLVGGGYDGTKDFSSLPIIIFASIPLYHVNQQKRFAVHEDYHYQHLWEEND
jgi:hypothetical protein